MPAPSLTRFAELARNEPAYWAHQLAMAGLNGRDDIQPDAWTKLCCCRYPRPTHHDADLACVATYCGIAEDVLRELHAACEARRRRWRA